MLESFAVTVVGVRCLGWGWEMVEGFEVGPWHVVLWRVGHFV